VAHDFNIKLEKCHTLIHKNIFKNTVDASIFFPYTSRASFFHLFMAILPENPKDRQYMLLGVRILGDFGATIAVPVVLFVLIGQWLEGKYGHGPWFTIIGFVLASVLSGKMIYKKAKWYGQAYQNIDTEKSELKK